MVDTSLHIGLRKKLVAELREKGIQETAILQAFMDTPRHFFLAPEFDTWAYKDAAFKIDASQTISQPYTVAKMTSLLEVQPKDKILEIGTGSGYQACILNYLGAKVYTIERHEILYKKACNLLPKIGHQAVRTIYGDGYKGLPNFAPFDKIIITAGATSMPTDLMAQLKIGGFMVIPFGNDQEQEMFRIKKISETKFTKENFGPCSFVPFLKGISAFV
jgi:protein-L-isoaspartate(D-aspartate) O-methyltransferase